MDNGASSGRIKTWGVLVSGVEKTLNAHSNSEERMKGLCGLEPCVYSGMDGLRHEEGGETGLRWK